MADSQNRQELKRLQLLGNSALLINILFFIVMFACLLLVPVIGFLPAVVLAGVFFVAFILYLNRKKRDGAKKG
ncbi:MAG TPA: hypothetical protein GX699_00970 [Firmicutes bacterium]|nr:hypothetical protein [Bacillota bacterium]